LLVDDQERLLDSTREVLLFLGYDACEAHDGKEALEVFEARRREIDLVLMDIGMPRMNGIDAFKAMIRIDPNARVVLMSGDYPGEESRKLRGLGLKGFVRKPFTVNQLAADVGAALETSR
jgi:DNA-binding response OmpR family regulator